MPLLWRACPDDSGGWGGQIASFWLRNIYIFIRAMFATIAAAMSTVQMVFGRKYNKALFIVIIIFAFNPVVLHLLIFPAVGHQYFL